MATIADTLNDIQKLQDEISLELVEGKECTDSTFISALMNFPTVYFFNCLPTPRWMP